MILPFSLMAQLTAPGSNAVRSASYSPYYPIFFYCNITGAERGKLTATSPSGTGPFSFAWYRWNDATNSFSISVKSESGVMTSSIETLTEGGYKVDIDSAGFYDTSLVGWIFFDRPPTATAKLQQQLCDRIALNGDTAAAIHSFTYKNVNNGTPLSIENEITFLWSSSPPSFIPVPDFFIDPIITNKPPPDREYRLPLEDVTYKFQVFSLGCTSEATFPYESIHVKADFTADPADGEAPLEVSFTNNSVRGSVFKWEFGDDSVSNVQDPMPHIYYKPGEYSVLLTIESDLHCIDSLRFNKINVDPSALKIPNVFTPDGDGYNDMFMVEARSLRFINMEIFSRSGIKVYSFYGEGELLKEWTGWDGNINNSSIKATPGVYFYIIRAYGWDDIKYDSKEYRGFVYLYR
ncbi:MAG: gliding motility-associated C-terminal domain-containing protein [Bacteroidales bacterium]|nr:gliding motility-associated C-terminal domain-containing protein [Bacteroidales bacterium]